MKIVFIHDKVKVWQHKEDKGTYPLQLSLFCQHMHTFTGRGKVHISQIRLCLVSNPEAVSERRTDPPLSQRLNHLYSYLQGYLWVRLGWMGLGSFISPIYSFDQWVGQVGLNKFFLLTQPNPFMSGLGQVKPVVLLYIKKIISY